MSAQDLRDRARSLRDRLPERRQATPPPEQGRRLATIPRPKGDDGQLWPDKARGFSIRLRELADVAAAIAEALELAEQHLARQGPRQAGPGAPASRSGRSDAAGREALSGGSTRSHTGFNEFGE
jgi:hypothetical protein